MKITSKLAAVLAISTGLMSAFAGGAGVSAATDTTGSQKFKLNLIARYDSNKAAVNGDGGVEIVAYDAATKKAFVVNGDPNAQSLDIIDMSNLATRGATTPVTSYTYGVTGGIKRVPIKPLHPSFNDLTSVAVHPTLDLVAVAVPAAKPNRGYVAFFDKNGNFLTSVSAGYHPDMITFTPDGTKALVANEGEPDTDSVNDPNGSVTIIDVSGGAASIDQSKATDVDFSGLTESDIDANVRIFPTKNGVYQNTPNNWVQDFEPEYITVDANSQFAYVSLQENNAIATLNLATKQYTHVSGLGYKNYALPGNGFDPSKKDSATNSGMNIANWPVLGTYMPDGIASFQSGGKTYLLTANEGDSRKDWGFTHDEDEVNKLKSKLHLDPAKYGNVYSQQQLDDIVAAIQLDDNGIGNLKVTTAVYEAAYGRGGSPVYDALYTLGARSFSIWDASNIAAGPVYDSGDTFERVLATDAFKKLYNVSNDDVKTDDRSTSKGPEPEDVKVGTVYGKPYAFVGLERAGGIMMFDITNPAQSQYVTYENNRRQNLTNKSQFDPRQDDLGPEGQYFVPAEKSPTGKPLLMVAHEISGTLLVYEITAGYYGVTSTSNATYTVGTTASGIGKWTVNAGVSGFKTFGATVTPQVAHAGEETLVFKHSRNGTQLGLVAVRADYDTVQAAAKAQFNVMPGDIVEVYMVDDLSDDPAVNPIVLQY
ncbi:MAG: choice-of-anchor I family protein [Paenibacillaceae bacterium]|nr:choice-of-anchor I family protein [Paenibacillaceae bacterium]